MTTATWLSRLKCKTVAAGAAVSPLLAASASAGVDFGATALSMVASVTSNWLADETREWLKTEPNHGFNHDLRRAMAAALAACLQGSAEQPGPLFRTLRDQGFCPPRLPELIAAWHQRIQSCLDSHDPAELDRLFPPLALDELNALTHEHLFAPTVLWRAFYDQALAADSERSMRAQACGGAEVLRELVPAALASVFPAQLAEALKAGAGRRAWIAYQKLALERVQAQIDRSDQHTLQALSTLSQHIDGYADAQLQCLQQLRSDSNAEFTAVRRAIGKSIDWLEALHRALRREHDPPLYTPSPEARTPQGVRALRFSEFMLQATIGRGNELTALNTFIDSDAAFAWWGIVGAGGMGKSHLALHLVLERQRAGWQAGFLESGFDWIGQGHCRHWLPQRDCLIVIDYASARAAGLPALLATLWERRGELGFKIRFLLLDRPGAFAPLFAETLGRGGDGEQLKRMRDALYRRPSMTAMAEPSPDAALFRPVAPVHPEPPISDADLLSLGAIDRVHWRPFLDAARQHFEVSAVLPADSDPSWAQIERVANGRPLLLLAIVAEAASLANEGVLRFDLSAADALLDKLLDREQYSIWPDACGVARDRWHEQLPHVRNAVALVTLMRGLRWSSERRALLELLDAAETDAPRWRDWLANILGVSSDSEGSIWLRPMEPDIFAEHLLAAGSVADAFGDTTVDQERLTRIAMAWAPMRCVDTLRLLVRDDATRSISWLHAALDFCPELPHTYELTIEVVAKNCALAALALLADRATSTIGANWHEFEEKLLGLAQRSERRAYAVLLSAFVRQLKSASMDFTFTESIGPGLSLPQARLWATGAVDSISAFGTVQQFRVLETWGGHLRGVASSEIGAADREIQLRLAQGAVNAINGYGCAQQFAALEVWGERLRGVASSEIGAADRENQLELAKGAVNAIYHYGSAQQFVALEVWGEHLRGVASSEIGAADREIQLRLAKGAVNAIYHYGSAQQIEALEDWGEHLRGVASSEIGAADREIQLMLAQGAVNAINDYGSAQRFEALEDWGKHLRGVASSEIGTADREIQLMLAQGAVNAIHHYGSAQQFEALEDWGEHLRGVASSEIGAADREIQLMLAQGAFNAIGQYGSAQEFEALEEWGEHLRRVTSSEIGSADREIQLMLAQGAVNAISAYGRARQFEALEVWGERLRAVASSEIGAADREIQLLLAKGAVNAISCYGSKQQFEALEVWGERLRGVASSEIGAAHREIQLELAKGAVNAIGRYGSAQRFEALEVWGERLRGVASSAIGAADREIQLMLAQGAFNAILYYGSAQQFEALKVWGERLRGVASSEIGAADREIQLMLARGAVNAIGHYGSAQQFETLEDWGQTLIETAERDAASADVLIELARGATAAALAYTSAANFRARRRWRRVFDEVSEHPELQGLELILQLRALLND